MKPKMFNKIVEENIAVVLVSFLLTNIKLMFYLKTCINICLNFNIQKITFLYDKTVKLKTKFSENLGSYCAPFYCLFMKNINTFTK